MRILSVGRTEVALAALIAAVFVASVQVDFRRPDSSRRLLAKEQIKAYLTALGSYKLDTGVYPTTEQGLQALRVKPENVNNWQGPYVQKDIDMDPWQHRYVYKYPGDHLLWRRWPAGRRGAECGYCQLEELRVCGTGCQPAALSKTRHQPSAQGTQLR